VSASLAAEACARRVAFIRSRIRCAPGRPSRLSMPDMGAGARSSRAVMAMIERPVLDLSRSISNSCGVQGRVSFWRGMKSSCYSNARMRRYVPATTFIKPTARGRPRTSEPPGFSGWAARVVSHGD
jgi:hypothetical protein